MAKAAQSARITNKLNEIHELAEIDLNDVVGPRKSPHERPDYRFGLSPRGDDVFVDCADNFRLVRSDNVIQRKKILTSVK
jgi:hypothetical protein